MLVAFGLEAMLTDAGAQVIGPAGTLDQAMTLAESEAPSAGILDVLIGGEWVWPLARRLCDGGTPVLFYTGRLETDVIRAEWPDCAVVGKPAMDDTLLAALAGLGLGSSRVTTGDKESWRRRTSSE